MADELTQALAQLRARAEQYEQYSRYYRGEHRTWAFATGDNVYREMFRRLVDNLCPAVVDAVADRLQLTGFDVEQGDESASEDAWAVWQANRMDTRAGQVHLEALRAGDAYVIVWPDAGGKPTIYPNAGAAMTAHHDPEQPGHVEWAAKQWALGDGRLRLNLYYADRIEKYVTQGKAEGIPERAERFEPFEVEGEPWPLVNPWGQVPVFHFANNPGLGQFGRSELVDVIPLQDALNKALHDMLTTMERVARPQRWATGLEVPLDEHGRPAKIMPEEGSLLAVGATEARFGQFEVGDLADFLAVQENLRMEVARVSGTPLHYLMLQAGGWPSGEAMKTAEARFLAKVVDRQATFGNAWEDALALALRMAGKAEAQLSAQWKDPTPRSEREQVEMALIKQQLGVSARQVLGELGYSAEQIERMQGEREAEVEQLGGARARGYNRGG